MNIYIAILGLLLAILTILNIYQYLVQRAAHRRNSLRNEPQCA
jgi:hypothetical protein